MAEPESEANKDARARDGNKFSEMKCCPEFVKKPLCDTLNFRYSLLFRPRIKKVQVPIEVVLHFLFERCSGGIVLGDPVYSITLLPGEQVRLFTSDRHSRWSYDSESSLAYRHATTSVESFYTAAMAQAMSDLTITESKSAVSSYEDSWAEGGGGASFSLFGFEIGGGGGGGSYDAQSTSSFIYSLVRHAESASRYVAASVRAKSAISIGEVERRAHAEGETEAHYESASRIFHNPNKCRAVTYLFYQINKLQKTSFKLVAIERRVKDPAAPIGVYQRVPVEAAGRVNVLPQTILANNKNRLEIEKMARTSAIQRRQAVTNMKSLASNPTLSATMYHSTSVAIAREPIDVDLRKEAIAAVDEDLASNGILDLKTRRLTETIVKDMAWVRTETLPTPGVLVKGCLDNCVTCEPMLQKEIVLSLERKRLENEMLKRQIELLEKSQEYRCCPSDSSEVEEPTDDE